MQIYIIILKCCQHHRLTPPKIRARNNVQILELQIQEFFKSFPNLYNKSEYIRIPKYYDDSFSILWLLCIAIVTLNYQFYYGITSLCSYH